MKARYEYDAEEIQRLIEEDLRARGHSVSAGDVAVPPEYAVSVVVRAAAAAPLPPPPASAPAPAVGVPAPQAPEAPTPRPPPERTWNSIEGTDGDPRFTPPPVRHDYVPAVRELGAPKGVRRLAPGNPWAGQVSDKQPRDPSASERLLDALYPDGDGAPSPVLDLLAGAPPAPEPVAAPQRLLGPSGAPISGEGGIDTSFLDAFLKR